MRFFTCNFLTNQASVVKDRAVLNQQEIFNKDQFERLDYSAAAWLLFAGKLNRKIVENVLFTIVSKRKQLLHQLGKLEHLQMLSSLNEVLIFQLNNQENMNWKKTSACSVENMIKTQIKLIKRINYKLAPLQSKNLRQNHFMRSFQLLKNCGKKRKQDIS